MFGKLFKDGGGGGGGGKLNPPLFPLDDTSPPKFKLAYNNALAFFMLSEFPFICSLG